MNHDDDKELSELLKRWDVSSEVPNTFHSSVWSQIAARQEARGHVLWIRAARRVTDFFATPAYATAMAAGALMISVGAAHVHAGAVSENRREAAQSDYLASINPLARISADGQHQTK